YDRHELNEKRQPQDIGIHSIRGGTIVGEHEVLFAGTDETIQITHRAQSKDIFANGAKILAAAVPLLDDFDIELTEAHHNKKVDAPSGTLEKLYDVIVSLKENVTPVYDRHELNEKRQPQDIGIHSIRGGTIVGEHEVLFAGTDETIQITHRAQSKDIFANGAIQAAERLVNKPNGFYTFDNL
ncbi:4-hydroxy-tetrahydrodipicolinate reductase, partial [Staphylococcus aureus]|uniref:4-hydroxy-tetrahydrodipicolinate reductase n=1 Tax=Staphylococcus aureus TaxID=1280 RepID=UPI0018D59979